MAIAPGLKRKGGLFGSSPMVTTPGIGDGLTAAQEPLAPAKPKFFGEGGVGRGIAGNIGDFLLQYSGMQPIYQPAMQQKQAMAYDEQKRERSRLQDWNDKIAYAQWERDNPKPQAPTNFEQILDAAGVQGDERIKLLRMKAQNEAQGVPMAVDITNPDGSVGRQYIRPGSIGGAPTAPAAPIGKLKPYGGQTATPSGNFR